MSNMSSAKLLVAATLFLSPAFFPGPAAAHDYRIGSLKIDHPWAVATPDGAQTGAGYMKITNEGTEPDRLIGLSSPASKKMSLHQSVTENGVVKMRKLDKLEIKPGETVEMKPETLHVMFEGLNGPLLEAGRAQGSLVFEKAGSVNVDYSIVPMGKTHSHKH